MPLRTSRLRHRLQFAAAILGTIGSVYGISRLIKPKAHPITTPPTLITYVPAPPIMPRVDPPVVAQPPQPKVSPAFMAAVGEGDIATMEKLYEKNMPLDGTLHTAAATGNKTTVVWLLEHGANVHENEEDTEAPVLAADAHPAVVKLLLDKGANEPDLSTAAMAGAPNAVGRLLAKHAVVNPKDGSTPLFDALSSTTATPQNKQIVVNKLLAAGADPNAGDGTSSPISVAIGSCEIPDDGTPAQHMAPPCIALIQALAGRGAKVNGESLGSVLDLADSIRMPVLDATLNARLEPGATAVALSQANGERDATIVKKLSSKGVVWSWHDGEADSAAPLIEAIDKLDVPLVRAMLEAGAPADLHLKDGRSPLGLALDKVAGDSGDAARIVELLIGRGANVNRRLPDGRSPLFAAAEAGDIRVMNAMLDHGARVNEVILDETALDAAERAGHIPLARILHARGGRRAKPADSTLSDRTGY